MLDPKAVAVVGMGAIMPDAEDAPSFWKNIRDARYSITDVPSDRWREDLYFDPDPKAPDKTYSKIGGWVRSFVFEPLKWGIPIPPSVLSVMDDGQKWGIAAARQALLDYGYPQKSLENDRVAVILGNALAGENHYKTSLRIRLPEFLDSLTNLDTFQNLPADVQLAMVNGVRQNFTSQVSDITEDTMPGELANIIAGRIANVFNFGGPNFVTDAACASSLAALQAAVDGLTSHQFDAVLTGGVDRNMGIEGFVKFCKIGALSPDGSRPFADGANGFVMGEGAVIFLLKRLADAEKDGDKIYAVVRGIGGSSDGKGKGITAPNPIGQQRAIERAWKNAGVNPVSVGLIEAHGTSTRVGDVTEVNSLNAVLGNLGLPTGSVGLGSVKSNVGHLKSAAGAAGLFKVFMALHEKIQPPSANFHKPNPNINFGQIPFEVVTKARSWDKPAGEIRRAGVSSFGFGGTNFHVVTEEWVPGLLTRDSKPYPGVEVSSTTLPTQTVITPVKLPPEPAVAFAGSNGSPVSSMKPYRGVFFLSAQTAIELQNKLAAALQEIRSGMLPQGLLPSSDALARNERIVIDYDDAAELISRGEKALKAFETNAANAWQALTAQGIYRGSGDPGKLAFLFPGQGSQYVNMLKDLCEVEPVVADTFKEADEIMTPILGKPLTSYIYVDGDEESLKKAETALRDTAITQPAMLTANVAMLRLMNKFGYTPDLVIGHSLGEYAALVASGVLTFAEALQVVSARANEMKKVSMADNGGMAAVSAPLEEVEKVLSSLDDYAVIANINSPQQSVIGGSTTAIDKALAAFSTAGFQATKIPVSHAFHTKIVAPASGPLKNVISRMSLKAPKIPVVANVTGELYPSSREEILEILGQQVSSPVQFIKGMQTLYSQGARAFVEVGPKRVLNALAADNFKDRNDVTLMATNHPRKGAVVSFNEALCGMLAAGIQPQSSQAVRTAVVQPVENTVMKTPSNGNGAEPRPILNAQDGKLPLTGSVVVSGAGLGLPGRKKHVFDDDNVNSILKGEQRIEPIPTDMRQSMVDLRPTRLEKSDSGAQIISIDHLDSTLKLAGQPGQFDPVEEFGIPAERADACDISTQLAIAAGIEALHDAGIPLVMAYRKTSKGTLLPDRWKLPESMADETGVIFASAFPGTNRFAEEADKYYSYKQVEKQLEEVRGMLALVPTDQIELTGKLQSRAAVLEAQLQEMDYHYDRRFIFRILAMGHSQFAEYIGARGPNTYVNAACATTTHAINIAEDWIRVGRCRRVVIIAGDEVTGGPVAPWICTGMLASGASTTEENIRMAALPFDRRRNGMLMGMGAAALVLESEDAVRERGMRAIAEVLSSVTANSAFHGTRLDIPHVSEVMKRVVELAEERFGIKREVIAAHTIFMSHETYTPARGGSASAEIHALRHTFGGHANQVIIANTKGFTGHTMGVGIEDVVTVKALQHGVVPPIAHIDQEFEPDPDLGDLNLSKGGSCDVKFGLRLGAGFGSQIAMVLFRVIPGDRERVNQPVYNRWLNQVSGYDNADLEVIKRTLRVRQMGMPAREPAKSTWRYGHGPTLWADQPETMSHVELSSHQVVPAVSTPAVNVQSAPAAQPEPADEVSPSMGADVDDVKAFVLQAVSEKTGYPSEMLDLDLDLEADLGIDTVKQAELFATIRTHYNIPRREDLRLVEYNTLNKVIQFMTEALASGTPKLTSAAQTPVAVEQTAILEPTLPSTFTAPGAVISTVDSVDEEAIKAFVLQAVSEKTGYPPEMLDMDLDLEADLGIDTVKQAELFATIRTHYNIPRREDLRLVDYNTLTKVVGFMRDALNNGSAQIASTETPRMDAIPVQVMAVAAQTTTVKNPETTSPAGEALKAEVTAYVLSAVSEKTGYPPEMLDMGLDLEADLGIDTVKQAELFATIRTHYNIPRREDLRLVDYNTLEKVVQFMLDAMTSQPSEPQQTAPQIPQASSITGTVEVTSSKVGNEEIKAFVLQAVSEKTGYPSEMLDMDLDLEADLGIDTVKQAELFATIRTHYNIPRREDLRLVDYNTLAKVVQFMVDALTEQADPADLSVVTPPEEVSTTAGSLEEDDKTDSAGESTLEVVKETSIRRRVPAPVLRPRLNLCLPTGITLDSNSRILLVADHGKTADALARRLRGRKAAVLVLTTLDEAALAKVQAWQAESPVTGMYYLPALDIEAALVEMDAEGWQSELENRVMPLYHLLRIVGPQSFLVCATRMGGLHGYGIDGASAPMGGAVSGFAKAMGMERPSLMVKVIDFSENETPARVANLLIEETLVDNAVVEVGWKGEQRFGIALLERPVESQTIDLGEKPVFVVSGGTGGIMAPVVSDLAHQTSGNFYLLGRSELPDPQDPEIIMARSDRAKLKHSVMQRMAAEGNKPTPKQVEAILDKTERAAATLQVMEEVRQAGGKAVYLVCDVTDPQSVRNVVKTVVKAEGRIDVLIHGAGMERSRKLESKPLEEVRETFAIKAGGLFHLLKACEKNKKPLKAVLSFTSVAGRFGNAGQADYSAANDLVCRMTYALRRQNPGLKVLAIDWSAWAQVGMASRGSIPMLMERAGIELMEPQSAAPLVYQELFHGAAGGEVVLAGSLGMLENPRRADRGIDLDAANKALIAGEPIHVMLSRVTGLDLNQGVTLEAELDPTSEPFLKDHAMNGIPLLPGVMGIEGFSVAAKHIASVLGSEKSGFEVARLEDVHFLTPFKFYKDKPRRITWKAQAVHESGGLVTYVTLESTMVRQGQDEQVLQHFSGLVHLIPVNETLDERTMEPPVWNGAYTVEAKDIYKLYFHGPSFQVLEGVQRSGEIVLGKLHRDTPKITSDKTNLITTPILLELCMQTAGIWEAGASGTLALPSSIGELRLYHQSPNGQPIFAAVTPIQDSEGNLAFNASVVDAEGKIYLELEDYRTSRLPYTVDETLLMPLRELVKS